MLALVKGNREPHEAKKKSFDLGGNRPMTSGLDLPLLCLLSYKVTQRKSGTILDGESRRRESKAWLRMNVVPRSTGSTNSGKEN